MPFKRINRWLNRKQAKQNQVNQQEEKTRADEEAGELWTSKQQDQANIFNYRLNDENNITSEIAARTTKNKEKATKEMEIKSKVDTASDYDNNAGTISGYKSDIDDLSRRPSPTLQNNLANEGLEEERELSDRITNKDGDQKDKHDYKTRRVGTNSTENNTTLNSKNSKIIDKWENKLDEESTLKSNLISESDIGLGIDFDSWLNQNSSERNLSSQTMVNKGSHNILERYIEAEQEMKNKYKADSADANINIGLTEVSEATITNEEVRPTSTKETDFGSTYDYTSGMEGGFNINLNFSGEGWSLELMQEAESMAELLSTLIIGDIPDEEYKGTMVDDLSLNLELGSLDGGGGVLGHAGIREWRKESNLPLIAEVYFDVDDSERLLDQGRFDDLVLHEMIHAIGFISTNKSLQSLVDKNNFYIGINGVNEYQMGLENGLYKTDNGLLTNWDSGFHWDEMGLSLQTNEIMSANIHEINHLSTVTLGVIEDLGYKTILGDNQLIDAPVLLHEVTSNWTSHNEWS